MFAYAFAIFLGAFLLFQVQPLLGRYILPWFGGGPSVWTSCMLFFQTLLLAGYAYAHGLATRLPPRRQGAVHLALLAGSLLALPIDPHADPLARDETANPTGSILWLLMASAGLPYVILSATSPLLQRWFDSTNPGRSPYRLYALSNAGSLLALLSYPFVVEPLAGVRAQALGWSWAYGAFAAACGWCAWRLARGAAAAPLEADEAGDSPAPRRVAGWLALSACGSALLLGTTNQMTQEIAVVPFLWVLPLSLYLATFILCFESDRWYRRRPWSFALAASAGGAAAMLGTGGMAPLGLQLAVYAAALFAGCMVCHGELALSRPRGRHATGFYLILAAGGALGGAFVALAAPRLFADYWEYPFALAACCLFPIAIERIGDRAAQPRPSPEPALLAALAALAYAGLAAGADTRIASARNFHGVLQVVENDSPAGRMRRLVHGRTEHGSQWLDASGRFQATAYYGPGTGVELAFERHPLRIDGKPLRAGIVGLGAGTLAAYGRPGDRLRFYEINPAVVDFARERFTYLSDSAAVSEIVVGDARLSLERELAAEGEGRLDLLVIDAFSSGAIPLHLLTREAGEVYRRSLASDGLLLVHITNRFLDLDPALRGLAAALGLHAARIDSPADPARGVGRASWMALGRGERFFADPLVRPRIAPPSPRPPLHWTDSFAGLWQALR